MDWKSVVGSVAPWIGTALSGPLGGMAVSVIADTLGLTDKTEGAIKQALSGVTPEQMLALKNADNDFAIKMRELGYKELVDLERLIVGDRDSARKREMTVQDKTPRNLAYFLTAGFFGVLVTLMLAPEQVANKEVLYVMLGALGSSWTACISYYFGSTKGSQAKTELLANSTPIKK